MVTIREYEPGDEKNIISLFNKVFETKRVARYWHWQFKENPVKESIIIVAEDESEIIGQSTLLPTKIIIKGKEAFAGQNIDTMVDENHRRQGIYENMALKTYALGAENEMEFAFRFPSKQALDAATKKLDSILVTEVPLYVKVYNIDNLLLSIIKFETITKMLSRIINFILQSIIFNEKRTKIDNKYIIKEVHEFDEDFDRLWLKLKCDSPITSQRTAKFLNWRIKNHPSNRYRILAAYFLGELKGYIVVKTEERKLRGKYIAKLGSIVDMISINQNVVMALYAEAKEIFKKEKIDFAMIWGTDSMKYLNLFKKIGFFKTKSTIPFVVKDLKGDKEQEIYITDEKNWYLMPIESDFY